MPEPPDGESYGLVGCSPQMATIRALIRKIAFSRLPVLILGETGTGKEVVARAIQAANPQGPFVTIDCGTLSDSLVESELFGYAKGAFTGAGETRKGLVEAADGGTAFFDEIGDLRLELQVKLLRLLQENEYRAVGDVRTRKVDVRVIAATHRDLPEAIQAGRFRQDLYYRLKVLTVKVPPLRERREDIPLLAEYFLARSGCRHTLGPDACEALMAYDWPGNVRELENAIRQMTTMNSGPGLNLSHVPTLIRFHLEAAREPAAVPDQEEDEELPVVEARSNSAAPLLQAAEEQAVRDAMARTGGRRGEAAKLLGVGRTTLYRMLKKYRIPN